MFWSQRFSSTRRDSKSPWVYLGCNAANRPPKLPFNLASRRSNFRRSVSQGGTRLALHGVAVVSDWSFVATLLREPDTASPFGVKPSTVKPLWSSAYLNVSTSGGLPTLAVAHLPRRWSSLPQLWHTSNRRTEVCFCCLFFCVCVGGGKKAVYRLHGLM